MGSVKTYTLIIRADASPKIGTGHIMRCIALGQAWQNKGGEVTFVSHCESEALKNRIVEEGFVFAGVPAPHPDPTDIEHTLKVLADSGNEAWLVLDGYHFDPAYQKCIRDAGYRLLVIDDRNHLPFYHADILLNQNIYAPDLKYKCNKDTIQLLGSKYVLLRREFLDYGPKMKKIRAKAKKILVTMGGADPKNLTLKVIQAIKYLNDSELRVKVVVGPANEKSRSIKMELDDAKFEFKVLSDFFDMAQVMNWADVAISAAGSTCWELALLGTPSLFISMADNQRGNSKWFSRQGASICIDSFNLSTWKLKDKISELIYDYENRKKINKFFRSIVDGNGQKRILEVIKLKSATNFDVVKYMRLANYSDTAPLWVIANEEGVRQNSLNREPITWNTHVKWFRNKIESPSVIFWVVELGGVLGGQVRYEKIDSTTAELHFSVLPSFRGKKIVPRMINHTFRAACKKLQVEKLRGIAIDENLPSMRVFEKMGFFPVDSKTVDGRNCIVFERIFHESKSPR